MNKPVAVAALMPAEAGVLQLDDFVAEYIPAFADQRDARMAPPKLAEPVAVAFVHTYRRADLATGRGRRRRWLRPALISVIRPRPWRADHGRGRRSQPHTLELWRRPMSWAVVESPPEGSTGFSPTAFSRPGMTEIGLRVAGTTDRLTVLRL